LFGTKAYGMNIPVLSMTGNGTTIVLVTTDGPHGLVTGSQVAVWGVNNADAFGFYGANVRSATAFTFETVNVIPSGTLLTPTTKVITVNIGLPWGYLNPQLPVPSPGPGENVIMELLTVISTNTLSPLSHVADGNLMMLVVNGGTYLPIGPSPAFTYSGTSVSWTSPSFSISTTDVVYAIYTY